MKEVAGEKSQRKVWDEVLIETNPHGIIYVVDSPTDPFGAPPNRETRLHEEADGIMDIVRSLRKLGNRRLGAFMILVNKIDKQREPTSPTNLATQYKNEQLLPVKRDERTIESHLRDILPVGTPINCAPYCAEWEDSPGFKNLNKEAIMTFKSSLQRSG